MTLAHLPRDLQRRLSTIKIISFDLDDTLWPLEPTITRAEESLYEWMQLNVPTVTRHHSMQSLFLKRQDFAERNPVLKNDVTALRKAALTELFSEHELATDLVDVAFNVFYQARSAVVPFEGAIDLLVQLRERYKIAALTNGNADLSIAGMAKYFDDVQHATLSNPPKPASSMFERTALTLGASPAEILHVGDNPETDVGGGKNAGAVTAWINPNGDPWPAGLLPADIEIQTLQQLLSYLPPLQS